MNPAGLGSLKKLKENQQRYGNLAKGWEKRGANAQKSRFEEKVDSAISKTLLEGRSSPLESRSRLGKKSSKSKSPNRRAVKIAYNYSKILQQSKKPLKPGLSPSRAKTGIEIFKNSRGTASPQWRYNSKLLSPKALAKKSGAKKSGWLQDYLRK